MDQAFRDAMTAGYALTEPGLVIGSPMLDGELVQRRARPGRARDAQPPRADRRRDRHGQDQDPAAARRPAVEGRRAGLRGRHQGRPDRHRRARRRRPTPRSSSASASLGWTFEPSGHPVEFLSLSGKLGAQVRATVHSFGPLLLGKVLDLNETQTSHPRADLQVLRRQRPAAARPQGPRDDAQVPRVRRGQADPRGLRRDVERRRSACSCARSSSSSRRAPTSSSASPSSTSTTCCATTPDGAGHHQRPRALGRHGQAAPVLHVHALDARPAVRGLPEAGDLPKPKLCFFFDEAHLLFDDASEALMDQVERTARLIRSKGVGVYFVTQAPTDVPVVGPGAARQPRPARAARVHARRRRRAAQDRPDVPDDRLLRRREDDHLARDRRGAGHRPVAEGRADAARRDPAAAARFADGADRPRRSSAARSRPARSRPSTARPSIARAPTS